jgi:hypothetical protein
VVPLVALDEDQRLARLLDSGEVVEVDEPVAGGPRGVIDAGDPLLAVLDDSVER